MPSPRHWISPRCTGNVGQPSAKHDTMSVPPEIDDSCTCDLTERYTQAKPSGGSGEPVDSTVRRLPRSTDSTGTNELFSSEVRYLALVPKMVTRSSCAICHSAPGCGWNGLPS